MSCTQSRSLSQTAHPPSQGERLGPVVAHVGPELVGVGRVAGVAGAAQPWP